MIKFFNLVIFLGLFSTPCLSAETIELIDDEQQRVEFAEPVRKVISLSPHATELLFAAGVTSQLVATVSYSDYPEAAKEIPRIGSANKIDLESIIKLNPDVIIAWKSGSPAGQIKKLTQLGFKIYYSEPRQFEDVASNILKMGQMLGTSDQAEKNAKQFLKKLNQLRLQYNNRSKVSVFYQVWNEPLMTINKDHMITSVIEFCGGDNIYANLSLRAPRVGIESVLSENPEAIIIGMSEGRNEWVESWSKWPQLKAVKNQHVFVVNADYIVRQGTRVLDGIKVVCSQLDEVRRFLKVN